MVPAIVDCRFISTASRDSGHWYSAHGSGHHHYSRRHAAAYITESCYKYNARKLDNAFGIAFVKRLRRMTTARTTRRAASASFRTSGWPASDLNLAGPPFNSTASLITRSDQMTAMGAGCPTKMPSDVYLGTRRRAELPNPHHAVLMRENGIDYDIADSEDSGCHNLRYTARLSAPEAVLYGAMRLLHAPHPESACIASSLHCDPTAATTSRAGGRGVRAPQATR